MPSIERSTGWRTTQTATISEGLKALLVSRHQFAILVFTIAGDRNHFIRFVELVNRLAARGTVTRPFLLALSTSQPPEFTTRLERLGVQLLLRRHPDQIVEIIKKMQWQARATQNLPTLILERRSGQIAGVRVNHRGETERLRIGPRLFALVAYLAIHRKTEHSTRVLADVLGISLASLKEYLKRLRAAWDLIRRKLGTSLRGQDIFWTKRFPGGFVHGLRANVEIEESEEFFLPEEDCYDSADVLPCHLCRRSNLRSETVWTHLGWMCVRCAEELHNSGEQ